MSYAPVPLARLSFAASPGRTQRSCSRRTVLGDRELQTGRARLRLRHVPAVMAGHPEPLFGRIVTGSQPFGCEHARCSPSRAYRRKRAAGRSGPCRLSGLHHGPAAPRPGWRPILRAVRRRVRRAPSRAPRLARASAGRRRTSRRRRPAPSCSGFYPVMRTTNIAAAIANPAERAKILTRGARHAPHRTPRPCSPAVAVRKPAA